MLRPLIRCIPKGGTRFYRKAPAPTSAEVAQLLEKYHALPPPVPLNLTTMLSFGRPLTEDSLLKSSAYALSEIPRRLAKRVRSLETLPFVVGTNPYISAVLNAHRESFMWLATYAPPTTLENNDRFAESLEDLVNHHANDIPTLAKGFQECTKYMSAAQINSFLDATIRSRISVRLIAEQHVCLSHAIAQDDNAAQTGIVDTHCSPKRMIEMCGSFVSELCEATLGGTTTIEIDGQGDASFPYVPVHLEYILTELLKNSYRAAVEHHRTTASSSSNVTPIRITLVPPMNESPLSERFFTIRIRDHGGGVSADNLDRVFSYAFTTAGRGDDMDDGSGGGPYAAQHVGGSAAIDDGGSSIGAGNLFGEITRKGVQTGMGTIAGLGYGLPMSRLYAGYFGGSLDLRSLEGWGSDVILKLRCLNEAEELS